MPITINSNIASLNAQRRLQESTGSLSTSFQRLSSGLRINRASDDAAGLAVATGLNTSARIFTQALRNVNDGTSLISVAEGALQQLSGITTRISELAEQSANGIYGASQRQALDKEAQALKAEFSRILASTSFNGLAVLSGSTPSVAIQVGDSASSSSQIKVAIGAPVTSYVGDGTYASEVTLDVSSGSSFTDEISIGDINNDGHNDLVWGSSGRAASMALGNGNGTFRAATTIGTGTDNYPNTLVDLNGDGNLDYLQMNSSGGGAVLLGNGNGTFSVTSNPNFLTGGGTGTFDVPQVADFNGDGKLDVLAADNSVGTFNLSLGNGNGTFKAFAAHSTISSFFDGIATGDVNNDGNIDVLVLGGSFPNDIDVWLGNGNGTFKHGSTFISGNVGRGSQLADINNDGNLDIVGQAGGVLLGTGGGNFGPEVVYDGMDQILDVNGDGSLDLVVRNGPIVEVQLNNGNGTFKISTSYAVSNNTGTSLRVGDLNGDGVADIVTGSYNTAQNFSILYANAVQQGGLGSFSLATQAGARSALTTLRSALSQIDASLGGLGASQSRLDTAMGNIQVARENYTSAAGRITDTDIAEESSQLTRNNILQQAGAAVLAQANQQPSLALRLLQNI